VYGAYYWRRATKEGAISCFVLGTVIAVYYTFSDASPPFGVNVGIFALIINVLVFIAVSVFTKSQPKAHVDQSVEG
jgi:SSS family solute:Na+ symporter